MNAISLFSCIGISEYYLKDIGVNVLVASDIDPKRCDVHHFLYPETSMVCGDITEKETKDAIIKVVGKEKVDLIISTPPCQGLSSVGKNKGKALVQGSPDKPGGLSIQLCKSEKKEFYIRYSS